MTMGIVEVAFLAALVAAGPGATMTSTADRTKAAARPGKLSPLVAQRVSTLSVCPSIQPNSPSFLVKAFNSRN